MRGRTKVAEWPLIFPNQIVAGCDSPVQQRGNLEPLLDMTHKTNRQGRLLGASHTKKTRKVLNKEQREQNGRGANLEKSGKMQMEVGEYGYGKACHMSDVNLKSFVDAAYHHVTDIVMGFFVAGFTWVTSY
ncbi:hypothetical protein F2Q69_00061542 [Brassica cretica]|uniref:Uncharacterized protein n=1 Tax=Brassica cretica TaxID=69181 RepID=A0A8S9RCJ3_BRACR|nr:hypothetical protein F2Q69_00061542 [Brassica cretica]